MQKVWCSLPSAWTVIDSETLAAPASSVSFTGISDTYRMFRVTAYIVKDGSAGSAYLRFNNDSGANYDHQRLTGNGTSVAAARVTGDTEIDATVTVGANQLATLDFTIAKQVTGSAAMVVGAATFADTTPALDIDRRAGRWNNTTDLISRIDLISGSGNFAAGTTVVLEGL